MSENITTLLVLGGLLLAGLTGLLARWLRLRRPRTAYNADQSRHPYDRWQ